MTVATKRRVMFLVIASVIVAVPAVAQNLISTGVGVNFFRHETAYLTTLSAAYHRELSDRLESHIGGDFSLTTRVNDEDEMKPRFVIPADVGLNFTFPQSAVTFLFGAGLTSVFNINTDEEGDDEFHFYMGPYVKSAMRVKVHPIMSWYIEYQQGLLIGGTNWINSASRVATGINFAIERSDD